MLDDIRNHDALPTREEREWMALDEIGILGRGILLATVALAIGWSASEALEGQSRDAIAAIAPR